MLKYLSLIFSGLLFANIASAQNTSDKDTLTYYFKDNGQQTVKDSADYSLLILPKSTADKGLYPVLEFYKDGKPKLKVLSRTHSLNFALEGPATAYYPNGNPLRTLTYKDGKTAGEVTEFYPNGNRLRVSHYKDGNQDGDITEFYPNGKIYDLKKKSPYSNLKYIECWDSTGVALAQKGNGRWVEYDDDLKFPIREITVKSGVLSGIWQPVIDTTAYTGYDRTGPVLTGVKIMPLYKGGIIELNQFLRRSLVYPVQEEKNKISGDVKLTMIVEKNGALTHLNVTNATSKNLGNEAIRLTGLSAPWVPGSTEINGPPVRAQIKLTLRFTIAPGSNNQVYTDVYVVNPDSIINNTGQVYSIVEKQPEFPGGLDAFGRFIGNNVQYPRVDRENGITGRVIVTFVVEKDGSLTDIQAVKGPSKTLMDEGVRVIKLSPKWKPAVQNNKPVRVKYTVPIAFSKQE